MANLGRPDSAEAEDDGSIDEFEDEAPPDELPHPKRTDGDGLRIWFMTQNPHISLQKLEDCQAQTLALTQDAQSASVLNDLSFRLEDSVGQNNVFYHWCFYQHLVQLGYKLENNQLGRTINEQLANFLHESRAIWLLALSLDRVLHTKKYQTVAREKYIFHSQEYFKRRLGPNQQSNQPADRSSANDPFLQTTSIGVRRGRTNDKRQEKVSQYCCDKIEQPGHSLQVGV